MKSTATQTRVGYFGKIPARGDFIKATDNMPLITVLDDWLAQAMTLLSADPRWKITYDAIPPLHFAFIGPHKKRAIAGHIIASSDQAHRRFPFLTMSTVDIDEPSGFVNRSPMVLSRLWNRLETHTMDIASSPDPTVALHNLSSMMIDLEVGTLAYDAVFTDFMDMQTIGSLEAMLAQAGFKGTVRQLLLALGFLLQPVMASNSSRLEKSLILPLPTDPIYRSLVAAFWMQLITPFLLRADFELALFFTRMQQHPVMVLGFSGASAQTLHAIMDPHIGMEHHIAFEDAQWVEEQMDIDYGIKKLSSYLVQPELSLKSALDSFSAAFIGA